MKKSELGDGEPSPPPLNSEELAALQEWELDMGGTVRASEANAFIDGFRAGLGDK